MQISKLTQTSRSRISLSSLLLTVFLSLAGHTNAAGSGAVTIDFESEEVLAPTGPPDKVWVTNDGVQHIRGFEVTGPVFGDINGTLTVVANIN